MLRGSMRTHALRVLRLLISPSNDELDYSHNPRPTALTMSWWGLRLPGSASVGVAIWILVCWLLETERRGP
eukprot:4208400-Pyramimonas_sp.AAC.1